MLHAARPRQYDARTPVLFVHHGVRRNGGEYRDYWLDLVDEACILAISIEFPEASFPEYLWYNSGNLHAKDSTPNPRETWTFGIDERLFEELRAPSLYTKAMDCSVTPRAASTSTECLSFGFRDRVAAAVSANAGTYAMPDLATPWPFGLGETNVDIGALRALLAFPITVTADTEDILTTGQFFPKGPRSMRQGATRYERARNYVRSGHNAAAALQTSCAWTIIDVPGVGHDGKRMSAAAAPVVAAALRDGS